MPRKGGSYLKTPDGLKEVEPSTRSHPDGDRARDDKGRELRREGWAQGEAGEKPEAGEALGDA